MTLRFVTKAMPVKVYREAGFRVQIHAVVFVIMV